MHHHVTSERLSFFTQNLVVGEVWMTFVLLWVFYTTSSPAGMNLSCFSKPSSCHRTRNPWHLCHAQIKHQVLHCMCAVSLRLSRNYWISLEGFGNKLEKEKKDLNPSLITRPSLYSGYLSARVPMHFAQRAHQWKAWPNCLSCLQLWEEEGASFLTLSDKANTKSTVCLSEQHV